MNEGRFSAHLEQTNNCGRISAHFRMLLAQFEYQCEAATSDKRRQNQIILNTSFRKIPVKECK